MPTELDLLNRIRELEEQNSALQDKLDEIWGVLAPAYEESEDGELIQIDPTPKLN